MEFGVRFSLYDVEESLDCVVFTKVEFIGKLVVCVIAKGDFEVIISVVK